MVYEPAQSVRGRCSKLITLACIAVGVAATSASAEDRPLPWAGGNATVTELEARLAEIGREFVEKDVEYFCNGNTDWMTLAATEGFDGNTVWGYVWFAWNSDTWTYGPLHYSHLSENACYYLDAFVAAVDKRGMKRCQTGTAPIYETQTRTRYVTKTITTKKRIKVKGRWKVKKVRTKKRMPVTYEVEVQTGEEPVYATCDDWTKKLFAINTFSHETVHLAGVSGEELAECSSIQNLAWFAWKLGADPAFAREIARDYVAEFYDSRPEGYWSPLCYDGGPWDLSPGEPGWPTPD